jgi:hypothetical protein
MADQILAIAADDGNDWSRRDRDRPPPRKRRPRPAALPFAGLAAVESAAAKLRHRPNLMARLETRDALAEVMKEIRAEIARRRIRKASASRLKTNER